MAEIAEAAFQYQQQLEKGDKKVVGVNVHTGTVDGTQLEILRVSHEVESEQVRDAGRAPARPGRGRRPRAARPRWSRPPGPTANMVPPMLAAVRAEATLGEICDALRAEWGSYTEPARF